MAKQTWVKDNGQWRKVKSAWNNVSGVWKKDVMPKGVVNGGWREFMSYVDVVYYTTVDRVYELYSDNSSRLIAREYGVTPSFNWVTTDPSNNIYTGGQNTSQVFKTSSRGEGGPFSKIDGVGRTPIGFLDQNENLVTVRDDNGTQLIKISPSNQRIWETPLTTYTTVNVHLTIDKYGDIYYTNRRAGYIYKYNADGGRVFDISVYSSDMNVIKFHTDRAGDLYIATNDTGLFSSRKVFLKYDTDGNLIYNKKPVNSFSSLSDMKLDGDDNIYVLNGYDVHKISKNGVLISTFKNPTNSYGGTLDIAKSGNIYYRGTASGERNIVKTNKEGDLLLEHSAPNNMDVTSICVSPGLVGIFPNNW